MRVLIESVDNKVIAARIPEIFSTIRGANRRFLRFPDVDKVIPKKVTAERKWRRSERQTSLPSRSGRRAVDRPKPRYD